VQPSPNLGGDHPEVTPSAATLITVTEIAV